MRLLNTNTVELENFVGSDLPRYAILSHIWGDPHEEVFYSDITYGQPETKRGYTKIQFCIDTATKDGLNYVWIDTCCIDKTSSAELSESINSMFRWYAGATKCYVYLSDVSVFEKSRSEYYNSWQPAFRKSKWFTRSWTLPELIAPKSVEFFSFQGTRLGDKSNLEQLIHEITTIPIEALRGHISAFKTSERLSWANGRTSTREEDVVYSLLGLFEVHMPLIYGEGRENAFKRFQKEIRDNPSLSETSSTTKASSKKSSHSTGMRLLETKSDPLRLVIVPLDRNLQYAILSHTWGDDEVTYEDMRSGTAEQKPSYSKLRASCEVAAQHGFDYLWVDTCCINKTSSSELQEAICSMWQWYRNAKVCYVYLTGCKHTDMESFASCRWFKRGWTLQELIAPLFVEFYDENWNEIGTKQSLCDQIADITSIDPLVLRGTDPTKRTIAERMSWAASRETTRVEDIAYSLMGLFNVFMPMLYGEGSRAFIRLQEEIIKQTEDYTIFAWSSDRSSVPYRGMLAQSPSEFRGSGPHQVCRRLPDFCNHPDGYLPPALSSRGLVLTLPLAPYAAIHGAYLGWIACVTSCPSDEEKETNVLCICLQEVQASPQTFARIDSSKLEKVSMGELRHFKEQSICVVPSTINQNESRARSTFGKVVIQQPTGHDRRYIIDAPAVSQGTDWARDTSSVLFHYEDGNRPVAAISFGSDLDEILVIIGLQDNMLWCSIVFDDDDTINDPIRVLASHSSRGCSDRARATRNGTLVNATLRAARSDQPETSIFNLSLRLSGQS